MLGDSDMKHIQNLSEGLEVFKALSSEVRLKIIQLLVHHKHLNMNVMAEMLGITNGALTAHIKILSECGLVDVQLMPGKRGLQKVCHLKEDKLLIEMASEVRLEQMYQGEIDVGHFTAYQIYPTCGIATKDHIIGEVDDPRYFDDPERINAGILWFTKGFIEYRIPNYLKPWQKIVELQFSMELSSEAPGICEDWPSDIYFSLNGIPLGYWTSPGDFGAVRGLYTPVWWFPNWNQYGLLKLLSINSEGTFIDGKWISGITIEKLNINHKSDIILRVSVPDTAENIGGMTIFGRGFGNYNQGIKFRIIFENQANGSEQVQQRTGQNL